MTQAQELSSLGENDAGTYTDIAGGKLRRKDERTLARLGKRQVLKVSYNIQKDNNSKLITPFSVDLDFYRCSALAARFWRHGQSLLRQCCSSSACEKPGSNLTVDSSSKASTSRSIVFSFGIWGGVNEGKWRTCGSDIRLCDRVVLHHVGLYSDCRIGVHVSGHLSERKILLMGCQSAPIAGGQFFWVSMLAPNGYKRFASYITGQYQPEDVKRNALTYARLAHLDRLGSCASNGKHLRRHHHSRPDYSQQSNI